jgi:hypothetical protein
MITLSQPTRTQLTDKDTADWLTQFNETALSKTWFPEPTDKDTADWLIKFNETALSKTAVQADHESLPPGET